MVRNVKYAGKSITIKVVGGIGNQLFCYFAGYCIARDLELDLIIDVTDIRSGKSTHRVSIESLNLPGTFVAYNNSSSNTIISKIMRRIRKQLTFLNRFDKNYYSEVIGYDKYLSKIEKPTNIHGYFQSYKYFQKYALDVLPIRLREESDWYISTLAELEHAPFISIHVRRGDYESLSGSYGLLNQDYYRRAIGKLDQLEIKGRFVVFSDDINQAKGLLGELLPSDTFWVVSPSSISSIESLMLMTHATANIIANSTFSWWGAKLNVGQNVVIAPAKWFRSMSDPENLYPSGWHLLESSWED
jgi:hypothetical protein